MYQTWTFCNAKFSLRDPPLALNLGTSLRAVENTVIMAATAMSIFTDKWLLEKKMKTNVAFAIVANITKICWTKKYPFDFHSIHYR